MSCVIGRGTRALAMTGAALALVIAGCTGEPPGGRASRVTADSAVNEPPEAPASLSEEESIAEPAGEPAGATGVSLRVADRQQFDDLLQRLRGKVVLVDFWATWCVPCVQQFPHTVEMHRKHAERGLAVVSVSLDEIGDLEKVRAFLEKQDADFDNLLGHDGNSGETFDAFEVDGVPQYRVYDRTGQLRRTFTVDPSADKQFTPDDVETAAADLLLDSAILEAGQAPSP